MKIKIVFDFDEEDRRAIARSAGGTIAPRREVVSWVHTVVDTTLQSLRDERRLGRNPDVWIMDEPEP